MFFFCIKMLSFSKKEERDEKNNIVCQPLNGSSPIQHNRDSRECLKEKFNSNLNYITFP